MANPSVADIAVSLGHKPISAPTFAGFARVVCTRCGGTVLDPEYGEPGSKCAGKPLTELERNNLAHIDKMWS